MAIRISNDCLEALIEEKGAELVSLADTASGREMLWEGDPRFWSRHAPILFPVVGKLREDSYPYDGRKYSMGQHGFARDCVFKVISKEEKSTVFSLDASEKSLEMYPFMFHLEISYELKGRTLTIRSRTDNRGCSPMPFSIGFHPGFRCPFDDGEKLGDYALFFEKPEDCERLVLENGLVAGKEFLSLTGGVIALSEELFERDALILKGLKSQKVALGRIDERGQRIEVAFPGTPYLGIWKKKDAPFVCIEPWRGLADHKDRAGQDIFNKEGIIVLDPGASFAAGMTITLLYAP